MVDARRTGGAGLHVRDWPLAGEVAGAQAVLDWCRETLAGTRRPWGIAHFDLAVAVHGEDGACTLALNGLTVADCYDASRLPAALTDLLEHTSRPTARVSAALFSWGDAAHAALP